GCWPLGAWGSGHSARGRRRGVVGCTAAGAGEPAGGPPATAVSAGNNHCARARSRKSSTSCSVSGWPKRWAKGHHIELAKLGVVTSAPTPAGLPGGDAFLQADDAEAGWLGLFRLLCRRLGFAAGVLLLTWFHGGTSLR